MVQTDVQATCDVHHADCAIQQGAYTSCYTTADICVTSFAKVTSHSGGTREFVSSNPAKHVLKAKYFGVCIPPEVC